MSLTWRTTFFFKARYHLINGLPVRQNVKISSAVLFESGEPSLNPVERPSRTAWATKSRLYFWTSRLPQCTNARKIRLKGSWKEVKEHHLIRERENERAWISFSTRFCLKWRQGVTPSIKCVLIQQSGMGQANSTLKAPLSPPWLYPADVHIRHRQLPIWVRKLGPRAGWWAFPEPGSALLRPCTRPDRSGHWV